MAEIKLPKPAEANIPASRETKDIEVAVKEEVIIRKKGIGDRIRDIFLADDIENVKEYAISDVIIPGIKHLIVDSVSMLILGEAFSPSKSSSNSDRIRYSTKFKYDDDRGRKKRRDRDRDDDDTSYDEIIFRNIKDAEAVLDEMYEILKEYDYVSLKDYYTLTGNKSSVFDDNWGWDNLRSVDVRRCRGGYMLTLPKPKPLD